MASLAEELRAAMLVRLRASEAFSADVEGRISDQRPAEFPYAWVGVTETDVAGSDLVDLLATVHVWKRSGQDAAARLTQEARAMFDKPPSTESVSIVSWAMDYTEVRSNTEHSAWRGLVRFRAKVQRPANWREESAD